MTTPILTTKLYIPSSHHDLVSRPRLIKQLNTGLSCKLSLVSAPAGFGKSTLLSSWVAQMDSSRVAWLSLDEGDNDLVRFLTYFVSALKNIETDFESGFLVALQSPGQMNTEVVLTNLLNEIAKFSKEGILILDDYHVIESPPIDQAITFLLDHLPSQIHLVISSRIDPSLPLSRLRARGQMIEIRANDLRFTQDEVGTFLNQLMGFDLTVDNVAALEGRTEGWIAGLQLAALSIQGFNHTSEITDFINRFTGSDRYIQDYLADEVLRQQPKDVKDFLLQTSILDRMNATLCNFILEKNNSQTILESLETANLFIVSLDNERRWYRYHHLFADLLRQRLQINHQNQVPTLHRRASQWYEQQEIPSDTIRHALATNDFERAADLAELAWPAWKGSFQSITWLGWVKGLPIELIRTRPVLSVAYAWANLNAGNLEAAEARLQDAEHWLEPTTNMQDQPEAPMADMIIIDEEQYRELPVSLATARAYHAQAIGNIPGTIRFTKRVLDLIPDGDQQWQAEATVILGLAYWASGDLKAAYRTFSEGLARMNPLDVIVGTFVLVDLNMVLGQLQAAISTCKQAIRLATEHGEPIPLGTEDAYTAISSLHREQGDLKAAAQDLATSKKLGEQVELPDWQYRWCVAQAPLEETLGNLKNALDLLNEAERVFVRTPLPKSHPIPALKARVWLKQGRLAEALGWVCERNLSANDDLSYLRELEHLTLARVLIAQYKTDRVDDTIDEVLRFLERLLQAAEEGGRTGSVIEILVLQALGHKEQGEIQSALVCLERALTLAEPEGYVRIFVDEGLPMAQLLHEAVKRKIYPDYVRKLLAAFDNVKATVNPDPSKNLVEPLSERELEVLQLVAQGLTNREISERLYLALDTVKGHNRRVFGKLGVKKRFDAVEKARELGLLKT
jgi:LuxR family maltose regulon positive regulatory protein